jgi:hypothetical protein
MRPDLPSVGKVVAVEADSAVVEAAVASAVVVVAEADRAVGAVVAAAAGNFPKLKTCFFSRFSLQD